MVHESSLAFQTDSVWACRQTGQRYGMGLLSDLPPTPSRATIQTLQLTRLRIPDIHVAIFG